MKNNGIATPLAICISLTLSGQVYALGVGEVTAGNAIIGEKSPENTTIITQNSDRAVIDWTNFGIAPGETVKFEQPNTNSAVLNRVREPFETYIQGDLLSNGQVFVVNPRGVTITDGAKIDVGSLVLSSLNSTNDIFMAAPDGNIAFSGDTRGGLVVNRGEITAKDNVVMMGAAVGNEGVIDSGNEVLLTAGDEMTLSVGGSGMSVKVDPASWNNKDKRSEFSDVRLIPVAPYARNSVTNRNVINAGVVESHNGRIKLIGERIEHLAGSLNSGNGTIDIDSGVATNIKGMLNAKDIVLNSGGSVVQSSREGAEIIAKTITVGNEITKGGDYNLENPFNKADTLKGVVNSVSSGFSSNSDSSINSVKYSSDSRNTLLVKDIRAEQDITIKTFGKLNATTLESNGIINLAPVDSLATEGSISGGNVYLASMSGNISTSGLSARQKVIMSAGKSINKTRSDASVNAANIDMTAKENITLGELNFAEHAIIKAKEMTFERIKGSDNREIELLAEDRVNIGERMMGGKAYYSGIFNGSFSLLPLAGKKTEILHISKKVSPSDDQGKIFFPKD
ncbi:large exoproteins involved in heme utilization or adhesion [Yersinia nurmii]|uniref:Large exoproteins involved in heme utilization or adhesion n=1 Tax=Yersinia nurmii TaxID=685706 RepID=A0ABP1YCF3_9GAMM|nr:filamentous hemagglutinin N-terminal domain-containing protein [Yersinia nurmii]CNE49839.1 large exoproteins involved in heme utilization or adhesion [Yersinia nurmii]